MDTKMTAWFGKHIPISISIPPSLIPVSIFLCDLNPCGLVYSFIDALEKLITQSKAQTKTNFFQFEIEIKK